MREDAQLRCIKELEHSLAVAHTALAAAREPIKL